MLAKIQVEMSWAPWRSLNVAGTLEVAPPSKERYGRKRRHAKQVQKEDRKMAYIRYKEGCMEASTGARTVVSQACVADGPLQSQVYFPGGGVAGGVRGDARCGRKQTRVLCKSCQWKPCCRSTDQIHQRNDEAVWI